MIEKIVLNLSEETKAALAEIAEEKQLSVEKIIHGWVREWLFGRPNPVASSMAAIASALIQRGDIELGSKKITLDELNAVIPKYSEPKDGEGLSVLISRRLADVLPRTVALAELNMVPKPKWTCLNDWLRELVIARAADEANVIAAREAQDEEAALFKK